MPGTAPLNGSAPRHSAPRHTAVVDLGFGDAGKGTVVAHLCQAAADRGNAAGGGFGAVVRFNGGAQAAHNVVTDDGRHHTFAQFGSGSFTPGVETHLSRFMLVDPLALTAEADHLEALGVPDPFGRLTVDREALLTTPYHVAANRLREQARGAGRHGSCGMGIGETAAYALAHPDTSPRAGDCDAPERLRARLRALHDRLTDELGPLPDVPPVEACATVYQSFGAAVRLVDRAYGARLLRTTRVVFEGAQGVLLDEWHGFHPYTTWSTTTFANAEALLAEAGLAGDALRLGVVRAYTTRHGPGPLPTEDTAATAALPDAHNGTGRWQGAFRVGHFDAVAHRYAVDVCGGVDAVALTHLDAPLRHPGLRICRGYAIDGRQVSRLPVGAPGDLDRQAELTARLLRASAWVEPVPQVPSVPPVSPVAPGERGTLSESNTRGAAAAWSAAVAEALGAPVVLHSYGPRTGDKQAITTAVPRPADRAADTPAR
ncbi:adenylosuccinate synthase [Yinghuangia aomiensis]|uniref:Adenylosuccinate synthetase n=1 Tax=Yinghuangia aomiensis TaxID=676205 RepID=A0ABP9H3L0_9ACTN